MKSFVTLAVTGASGAPYALRLLELLLAVGEGVYLLISDAGRQTLEIECGVALPGTTREAEAQLRERFGCGERLRLFGKREWRAPVASGSSVARAMVVCPCSMGTLSAIAHGSSDTLLERAADVTLKEGRRLILVPRESPLSAIHLENMLTLARLGVAIIPPMPGFYHRPQGVGEIVDFTVARILDHLGVEHALGRRWGDD